MLFAWNATKSGRSLFAACLFGAYLCVAAFFSSRLYCKTFLIPLFDFIYFSIIRILCRVPFEMHIILLGGSTFCQYLYGVALVAHSHTHVRTSGSDNFSGFLFDLPSVIICNLYFVVVDQRKFGAKLKSEKLSLEKCLWWVGFFARSFFSDSTVAKMSEMERKRDKWLRKREKWDGAKWQTECTKMARKKWLNDSVSHRKEIDCCVAFRAPCYKHLLSRIESWKCSMALNGSKVDTLLSPALCNRIAKMRFVFVLESW